MERFPRMGSQVREYGDESIRHLIVDSYRVVYKVDQNEVRIVGVVQGNRDLLLVLGTDPGEIL